MASLSTLQSSSSTSSPHSTYDVFLSFRGEDTRANFSDHLYNDLVAYGIHTFRDDEELEKGEDIKSGLSTAIEESKIFVIIFSKNYAASKWCLNELVKIMTLKEAAAAAIVIIPVFYHVNPTDVGHQSGDFEDAFINHQNDANDEKKEMIKIWRIALQKAAKLSGYHVDHQHETTIIQKLREAIIKRLNRKPLFVGDRIVGMDFHLKQLKPLIDIESDDIFMVGIYGIGGIGKTTIAMVVYNDISSQFDGSSFLRGVREKSESERGLLELQKQLLKDILKGQTLEFNDICEGITVIKERLCSKKVLIVLDDIDELKQLENLAGENDWFGPKSRIIITTKDTSLLDQHGVSKSYDVEKLKLEEATKLFNLWAFRKNTPNPRQDFESLSRHVVRYANGLPIALKVLGGFLCNKNIAEWKSALCKLEKIPDKGIQSVLKVSYEKLEDVYKDIFLDIACFFKGEDKDFVVRILGEYGDVGVKVLHERCLISISENRLDMHDLIQQMGRAIVHEECLKEPGKRTRIWDPNGVENVSKNNLAIEAIEGLSVHIYEVDEFEVIAKAFNKMNKLRLLKVEYVDYVDLADNKEDKHNDNSNVFANFDDDSEDDGCFDSTDFDNPGDDEYNRLKGPVPFFMALKFPSELRYLLFTGYPFESLPMDFDTKNLVELDLRRSKIKQLWKASKMCENLKVINLTDSRNLIEIPDYSSMQNLEYLNLAGCRSLMSLPRNSYKLHGFPDIQGYMRKLRKIDLSGTAIIDLPPSIECLNRLEDMVLENCKHLATLPENIGSLSSLQRLDLSQKAIKEVPFSIGDLKALKYLDLSKCKDLVNLPVSICKLSCLETLKLAGCSKLKDFPELEDDDMKSLELLDLSRTGIEKLPSSIRHLKALKYLDLSECKDVVYLPESICNLSSLETLTMAGCPKLKNFPELKDDGMKSLERLDLSGTAIEELPSSIEHLGGLKYLHLYECKDLVNLPVRICHFGSIETLILAGCSKMKDFPEPKDDDMKSSLRLLDLSRTAIEKLPSSIEDLKALKCLDLRGCKRIVNLPEHVFHMSSLEVIQGIKDSNIERLEVNVTSAGGNCDFHILEGGVIWSNDRFSSLKTLNLQYYCNDQMEAGEILNRYLCPLSSLVDLSSRNSSRMKWATRRLPSVRSSSSMEYSHLPSLQVLTVGNFNPMERGIFSDIFCKPSLLRLSLCNYNPIPRDIWSLSSLVELSLSNCNLMDGEILNHICQLPSLLRLSLDRNPFSSLSATSAGISQISNLIALNLSHCKNLVQIPELPSSLRFLDAHCCNRISFSSSFWWWIHSLVNQCNADLTEGTNISVGGSNFRGKGMSVVIPRSSTGILDGISRNQSMRINKVTIELPRNWYENDDLLGFALYCVYVGAHHKVHKEMRFRCSLVEIGAGGNNGSNWTDFLSFESYIDKNDRASDLAVWVIHYPKIAISKQYNSNQWTHLGASFRGRLALDDGKECGMCRDKFPLDVKECGIHLIYASRFKCQLNEVNVKGSSLLKGKAPIKRTSN